jgi:hypothetical protein
VSFFGFPLPLLSPVLRSPLLTLPHSQYISQCVLSYISSSLRHFASYCVISVPVFRSVTLLSMITLLISLATSQ